MSGPSDRESGVQWSRATFLAHCTSLLPTANNAFLHHYARIFRAFLTQLLSDGPLPSKMQKVTLPIINNTECELMYEQAGFREHIPHIFICAGYREGGKDSCEVKMIPLDFRYTQHPLVFQLFTLKADLLRQLNPPNKIFCINNLLLLCIYLINRPMHCHFLGS